MEKIIEIVGIAGSGKSTLSANIRSLHPDWNFSFRLSTAQTLHRQIITLARHAYFLIRYSAKGELIRNFKLLIYIEALPVYLKKKKKKTPVPIVFDQGVVFAYTALKNSGLMYAPPGHLSRIRENAIKKYLNVIDELVILTSDKRISLERVLGRDSDHRLKHSSEAEISDFYLGYFEAISEVEVMAKKMNRSVKVIDTSNLTPDEVVYAYFGSV